MHTFRLCLWVLAMACAAALLEAGPAPQAQSAAPSGNKENGKRIFSRYGCYQCHGFEAQGAAATGPRLGPNPLAYARFLSYVRKPTGDMPPYTAKSVSDQEMADIYAFVQAQPRPPSPGTIPLLQ